MKKIHVNVENLETAVENFVYASKEAGEMNYRLKQLGNELNDDVDLIASPEYDAVMSAYSEAHTAISEINEFFESLLLSVIKTPEVYSEAERKSVDRINEILKKSVDYQKAITDNSVLESIIQKAKEEDTNIDALADLVNEGYNNVNLSNLSAEGTEINNSEEEKSYANNAVDDINRSAESVKLSSISAMAKDDSE